MCNFKPAMHRGLEVDIGDKCVKMARRPEMRKRLVHVTGRNDLMTQVFNRHLQHFADKHIVFDDKYRCHRRYAAARLDGWKNSACPTAAMTVSDRNGFVMR